MVFAPAGSLGPGDVSLETLEALFAVVFAPAGSLGSGDVSLETLEALFVVVFVFSDWFGPGVDVDKFELLFVELFTFVEFIMNVTFIAVSLGVSLTFDAFDSCVKLRQTQRQRNRYFIASM